MFPATFAPMILKILMPKIMEQFMEIFKLDKVLKYVEQPNELDVQMEHIDKVCKDISIKVEAMESVLQDLGSDSHPPVIDTKEWEQVKEDMKIINLIINTEEWEQVKEDMKKVRKLRAFKSLGK